MESNCKNMWDVIGHAKQVKILQKTIQSGKIGHAYLIIGPEGIGKMSLAQSFINELIDDPSHLINLDRPKDKKIISIKQIREARISLSRTTMAGDYNVCLINNAQTMTDQAANALLKTLEEPKGKAMVILLATTDSLPDTIQSRCQTMHLLPVPRNTIYDYVVEKTNDRSLAKIISPLAKNRPDIARQLIARPKQIDKIKEQSDEIIKFLESDPAGKIKLSEKFLKKTTKIKAEAVNANLAAWELVLRDALLIKNKRNELIINSHAESELKKIAANLDNNKIKNLLEKLKKIKSLYKQNINYKLLLENFLINI